MFGVRVRNRAEPVDERCKNWCDIAIQDGWCCVKHLRRLMIVACVAAAGVAGWAWDESYRRAWEKWIWDVPCIGDVRVSGMRGTAFLGRRAEMQSGTKWFVGSTKTTCNPVRGRWGFTYNGVTTLAVDSSQSSASRWPQSPTGGTLRSSPPPMAWQQVDIVGMPFWVVVALPLLGAGMLAVPDIWRFARRRRRMNRGACVHCGYDLTGNASGMCSECGVTIASR